MELGGENVEGVVESDVLMVEQDRALELHIRINVEYSAAGRVVGARLTGDFDGDFLDRARWGNWCNCLGSVVKIDYSTETRGRGQYARIAVLLDLQQPLVPWIKVDGKGYGIQDMLGLSFLGLHRRFFPEACRIECFPFGSWMKVSYAKKGKKQIDGKDTKSWGSPFNFGSRYNVLFDRKIWTRMLSSNQGRV
ncbi:hypothetical protein K1719_047172 [Acacia pycnantha]|nr:hypothetical protein K1719_047172 [Acacia pycnantha]